ncbi:MAG TPA: Na/Pi symporter [Ornithinimicrobium sp.]|uniref:Na/Pi symporter n=1 Tax=Ornithinimicrobium sp. TaxID=1977084 RepID=UPI002B4A0E41|nr:Na/Pi symporter [Ornithinimicrobium sp.]HKJ12739.1 Na/Pi symporter [Ornithinimicrobium sp.]
MPAASDQQSQPEEESLSALPGPADVELDVDAEPDLTTRQKWLRWVAVAFLFYGLVASIDIIGDGFKAATGAQAEQLFSYAENPMVGLIIGVLATTLIQSSSTTTSIVVGLVAGGLPVSIAVPMIMGANIGTTVTNTLASLGTVGQREPFRRAFAAATVHDFFNVLAVAIFLPLEIMTGFLAETAGRLAGFFEGTSGADTDDADIIGMATAPVVEAATGLTGLFSGGVAQGVALAVLGAAGILVVVRLLGMVLGQLMVGRARMLLHRSVGRGPLSGMTAGVGVTVLAQSSSVTTSLMVPLAAAGTMTLKQIYPYTLGANIGTTMTALVASLAATEHADEALTIALVHLLFNLFATVLIYGVPFLRRLPLLGAQALADLATVNKWYVVVWVLGVYLCLPGLVVLATITF